ncbi:BRCA1 C Terminus (BRCT) domain-containing protein [Cardiosporidium cionae]|uniref:BRCA1 C Terminus (BRCT) domain-containing protein n=1 Tax=Cardiosporidium cionae TaxID=476202 RepID=A0ABQ7J8E4_9APIC|nr:BRCA1 C Terminus (BRCT) domain-containing protein [Cardiosporidium cionae]|eukprot:KAF8820234.1 BRCA1 C Terminus (BRCT) domain-containing protein [Cardiosporidium cionae]
MSSRFFGGSNWQSFSSYLRDKKLKQNSLQNCSLLSHFPPRNVENPHATSPQAGSKCSSKTGLIPVKTGGVVSLSTSSCSASAPLKRNELHKLDSIVDVDVVSQMDTSLALPSRSEDSKSLVKEESKTFQKCIDHAYAIELLGEKIFLGKALPIFQSCHIWIDGRNKIDDWLIRQLVLYFGGTLEPFGTPQVTHVIADNIALGNAKWRSFFERVGSARKYYVVTSDWLAQCIKSGKRLPESNYLPRIFDRKNGKLQFNFLRKQGIIKSVEDSSFLSFDKMERNLTVKVEKVQLYDESVCNKKSGLLSMQCCYPPLDGKNTLDDDVKLSRISNEVSICKPFSKEHTTSANSIIFGAEGTDNCKESGLLSATHCPGEFSTFSGNSITADSIGSETTCLSNLISTTSTEEDASCILEYAIHATHPDFIRTYHKKSRLHFLGSFLHELYARFEFDPFVPTAVNSKQKILQDQSCLMEPIQPLQIIMHIDFDAFFASVALKKRPDLISSPVVVAHSTSINRNSSSEISSCNYVARDFGISNGMWLLDARKLCPSLIVLPYDFDDIRATSFQLFDILFSFTHRMIPLSCDEAYVQLIGEEITRARAIAKEIRKKVFDATACTVSIGIAENLLLAKLASKFAKPRKGFTHDGIFFAENSHQFMQNVLLKDLPGVGHRTAQKLESASLFTCQNTLRRSTQSELQLLLGKEKGRMIWQFCHGKDTRPFPHFASYFPSERAAAVFQEKSNSLTTIESKSTIEKRRIIPDKKIISISVNWGIRFIKYEELMNFLLQLARECCSRLIKDDLLVGAVGIKLLKRRQGASIVTKKFLGTGSCNELTRKIQLEGKSSDSVTIYLAFKRIWDTSLTRICKIQDIRGITALLSKLQYVKEPSLDRSGMSIREYNFKGTQEPLPVCSLHLSSFHEKTQTQKKLQQHHCSASSTKQLGLECAVGSTESDYIADKGNKNFRHFHETKNHVANRLLSSNMSGERFATLGHSASIIKAVNDDGKVHKNHLEIDELNKQLVPQKNYWASAPMELTVPKKRNREIAHDHDFPSESCILSKVSSRSSSKFVHAKSDKSLDMEKCINLGHAVKNTKMNCSPLSRRIPEIIDIAIDNFDVTQKLPNATADMHVSNLPHSFSECIANRAAVQNGSFSLLSSRNTDMNGCTGDFHQRFSLSRFPLINTKMGYEGAVAILTISGVCTTCFSNILRVLVHEYRSIDCYWLCSALIQRVLGTCLRNYRSVCIDKTLHGHISVAIKEQMRCCCEDFFFSKDMDVLVIFLNTLSRIVNTMEILLKGADREALRSLICWESSDVDDEFEIKHKLLKPLQQNLRMCINELKAKFGFY